MDDTVSVNVGFGIKLICLISSISLVILFLVAKPMSWSEKLMCLDTSKPVFP